MKKATLSTPQPVDPRTVTTVNLVAAMLICGPSKALKLSFDLRDAADAVLARRTVEVKSPAAVTYVTNQEATLMNALTQHLGAGATFTLLGAHMIFSNSALHVLYDQGGKRREVHPITAQSQTYVANQEQTLLQALLTKLGLSGTIA